MYQIHLHVNQKYANLLSQSFQRNYPNYTIKFVNSKGVPVNYNRIEKNIIWICDRDKEIRMLSDLLNTEKEEAGAGFSPHLPIIAYSHEENREESLFGAPWMILSPDSLTPELIREISFRSRCLPMPVAQTSRLLLRELSDSDLSGLLQLQEENKKNPGGCFFPKNCTKPDDFLKDYIRHQYYCYGYGIFGIFSKDDDAFMGIAGFSTTDLPCTDAEISYALLKRYQHHGYAREALRALLPHAGQKWQISRFTARIAADNLPSVRLAKDLSIPFMGLSH